MSVWVLTYGARGGYPASVSRRPMLSQPVGQGAPPVGWVEMTDAERSAAIDDTNGVWSAYESGQVNSPSGEKGFNMQSPDGTVYRVTIDDAGNIKRTKV